MFLADTSFIVSPFTKSPARRKWAQKFLDKHRGTLWTTAAAFTEASYLIGDIMVSARILSDYHFTVEVDVEKEALHALMMKHAPEMDFADATLVRASELHPSFKIVTDDGHFDWYRRKEGREPLPVVWIG